MRVAAVIPAGGAGRRLGGSAKAFVELRDKPLLHYVIDAFLAVDDVFAIVVALPSGLIADPPDWLGRPRIRVVPGGTERMHSVRAALAALPADTDAALIHDAARPLITRAVIERVISAITRDTGAVAALPANETMHLVAPDGLVVATPVRDQLWRAQTPQGFPYRLIMDAHAQAAAEGKFFTDDAGLVAHYGGRVRVVEGDPANLKITVPADLAMAERLLDERL